MRLRHGIFSEENCKPLVSVLVPTFNSEEVFERCLKSVGTQTYDNIEIIVVDNFSTDRTREIAEKYGSRIVLFKGIRSKARNVGADFAEGEYVLSIDSDMELGPDVIMDCVIKVREGYDAIIIPEVSIGEGFWAKSRALEKLCYIGDDLIEAARFFRKSVFDVIEGYDEVIVFGEDWDLNQRVRKSGFKIGRIGAFIKHYDGKLSLRETMLKKRYYGKTLALYRLKHPKEAKRQLLLARPAFIRNWRLLVKDPGHAFGMLIMKFCEFAAGWIGSNS